MLSTSLTLPSRAWTNTRKGVIGINLLLSISCILILISVNSKLSHLNFDHWDWVHLTLTGSIAFTLLTIFGILTAKKQYILNEIGYGTFKQVYHLKNSDFVLKIFHSSVDHAKELDKEFIAWKMGEELRNHLGIDNPVPEFIVYTKEEAEKLFPELVKQAPHLIKNGPLVFQRYIKKSDKKPNNPSDVLLFNWLIGRADSRDVNSILDDSGKVWEIDNGFIGHFISDYLRQRKHGHWLLKPENNYRTIEISPSLINQILDCPYLELNTRGIPSWVSKKRLHRMHHRLNQNFDFLKKSIRYLQKKKEKCSFDNIQKCMKSLAQQYSEDKRHILSYLGRTTEWESISQGEYLGEINIEISPGKFIPMPFCKETTVLDVLRYLQFEGIRIAPYFIHNGEEHTFSGDSQRFMRTFIHAGDTLSLSHQLPEWIDLSRLPSYND